MREESRLVMRSTMRIASNCPLVAAAVSLCVALSRSENNCGAHVSENGEANFRSQLVDILMREGETQPVFPRFR